MSVVASRISETLASCGADACWRQWRALMGMSLPGDEPPASSIIDPEALVLLSLCVSPYERRLEDCLRWCAHEQSELLSVQRMRSLKSAYPDRILGRLGEFASMATDSGDRRWRRFVTELASEVREREMGRLGKGPGELRLFGPATLMFRLRAGFGVGAKADLLAFLLGIGAGRATTASATASMIARAISYSVTSVRRAVSEMSLARFVDVSVDRPARYSVDAAAWCRLLESDEPEPFGATPAPSWRYWAQLFAFFAQGLELTDEARSSESPTVVLASRARDVATDARRAFGWNGIRWIDPVRHPGELYLDAFADQVDQVCGWIKANL